MFDMYVLLKKWLWDNFGWHIKRFWNDFPQTTSDPQEKIFRKKYFKEAMRHDWGSIQNHRLFDRFLPKKTGLDRHRRGAKRSWYILNHPQASTRRMTDLYHIRG